MQVELVPTDLRDGRLRGRSTSVREALGRQRAPVRARSARRAAGGLGRPREARPDPDEPARQRGQVLAGRRNGHRRGASPRRAASRCASSTRARASPRPSASTSSRSSTARTARGGYGGAGLGLFIARGLVLAMGGRIWVDSAEGGGSSFAFELPLAEATAQGDPERGIEDGHGARVLVIDDEAPIRLLCRVNLEAAGMVVHEAEDGVDRRRDRAARDAGRDPARRDDARHGRLGGVRRAARGRAHGEDPDRLPDGAGRAPRSGAWARARRRRLRDEAVRPAGARTADRRPARPRRARGRSRSGDASGSPRSGSCWSTTKSI